MSATTLPARGLTVVMLVAAMSLLWGATASADQGDTKRVSIATNGNEANDDTSVGSISGDSRYIAFQSMATNLVPGDTNGGGDVFVHDKIFGETTRVSVDSNGIQGNGHSNPEPSISAEGRYIAFESSATNLVPADSNDRLDVFVHDTSTGTTTRISTHTNGTQGNDHSGNPSISADGRYIAFSSGATNLVPGDTNGSGDVFIHDTQTGKTTRISTHSNGNEGNGHSAEPSISADGRYIAFTSGATNLVPGDTNDAFDVFVHDRQAGRTTRISVHSNRTQGNGDSTEPSTSADGRYVAFDSKATNLVPGDTNNDWDVFLNDRQTGAITRVSIHGNGTQGDGASRFPAVSADGRYVTFESGASNLVARDTNEALDVFVHDTDTEETTRVSVHSNGNQGNSHSGRDLAISADGRHITFVSDATNLVPGDTNGFIDAFVHQNLPNVDFFADDDGHLFEDDINAIAEAGITRGCNPPDNDDYCPDESFLRGQAAAFLRRALDVPASNTDHFTDDDGNVFEEDINAIAEAGITRGCNPPDNTLFCPTDPFTRGQAAAFVRRALNVPATDTDHFTDDNNSVFGGDINAIAEAGITRGCNPPDNDRYCPDELLTRGQAAAFMRRALLP